MPPEAELALASKPGDDAPLAIDFGDQSGGKPGRLITISITVPRVDEDGADADVAFFQAAAGAVLGQAIGTGLVTESWALRLATTVGIRVPAPTVAGVLDGGDTWRTRVVAGPIQGLSAEGAKRVAGLLRECARDVMEIWRARPGTKNPCPQGRRGLAIKD